MYLLCNCHRVIVSGPHWSYKPTLVQQSITWPNVNPHLCRHSTIARHEIIHEYWYDISAIYVCEHLCVRMRQRDSHECTKMFIQYNLQTCKLNFGPMWRNVRCEALPSCPKPCNILLLDSTKLLIEPHRPLIDRIYIQWNIIKTQQTTITVTS